MTTSAQNIEQDKFIPDTLSQELKEIMYSYTEELIVKKVDSIANEGMYMQSASETVSVKVANCQFELPSGEVFEQDVLILPTNDTPVILGLDIIKQGFFSLKPEEDSLHFHYELP